MEVCLSGKSKKNGRILLRIVENTKVAGKVKQKFICGLGSFHEDEVEEIQRYTGIGERLIIDFKNQRSPALPFQAWRISSMGVRKLKKVITSPHLRIKTSRRRPELEWG